MIDPIGKRCLNLSFTDSYAFAVFKSMSFSDTLRITDTSSTGALPDCTFQTRMECYTTIELRSCRTLYSISSLTRVL